MFERIRPCGRVDFDSSVTAARYQYFSRRRQYLKRPCALRSIATNQDRERDIGNVVTVVSDAGVFAHKHSQRMFVAII